MSRSDALPPATMPRPRPAAPAAWNFAADPRRSVALAVAAVVAVPGLLLLGGALWQLDPLALGLPGSPWQQAVTGAVAVLAVATAAGHVAARPWAVLQAQLAARRADDLSPLPPSPLNEVDGVAGGVNRLLQHQREAAERHQRLLADASHQLRTPLAVLRTQLQSVAGASLEPRVPEMLRTVDRATAVANQFLSQMKLQQRQSQKLPWQALRLDDIAQEAALEFSPLIATRRLQFALDASPLSLPADAWMLGELVRNLLANAIQHSPPGAPLGMVVRSVAGRPELIVWDSGPGISDEARERLFEPFAAASGGTGIGLGLSICRQLAEALGAQVHLFNRSDGEQAVGVDAVVRWNLPADGTASPQHHTGDPR